MSLARRDVRNWLVAGLVGGTWGALLPRAARADGPSDLEAALAEPVVTTASQSAEDQSTAPATSTTISAEDLRRYGIKTLAEAINFLSLGMITQNNLDDGEIGARGVLLTGDYGDHVLLLVNGHAVNEQWDGTAYFGRGAGVPFELIDHIEIILGPGSVLYGSQAMLGVINIVTKRAKDFEGLHFVGEGDLFTSGRGAVGFGDEFTLFGKRGEITYELEYYAQSGPAFLFGPQRYDKRSCFNGPPGPNCMTPGVWGGVPASQSYWAKLPDGYLRLLWGDFELDLHAESYQRSSPIYTYTAYNQPNSYEVDTFLSADLRHRWALSSVAQLKSRLYVDSYTYREQNPAFAGVSAYQCYDASPTCLYELPGFSRWVGLEEQLSFDWLHDQSLTTLLGVDGRAIRVGEENESNSLTVDAGLVPPYATFQKDEYRIAGYAQQTWRPLKWLSFNVGARIDEDFRVEDDQQYGHLSPRAVVAVNPWRGGTLKVIYSEAFRAPSYYETSWGDRQTQIPNLGLLPETVRSGEVSFEQRLGAQRLFVGGFDAFYSNMVSLQDAPDAALVAAASRGLYLPTPTPKRGQTLNQAIAATYGATSGNAIQQYQNVAAIHDIGVNAAFEGSALGKALRYGVNVTGAVSQEIVDLPPGAPIFAGCSAGTPDGTTPTESCPITVTPRVFGNARISYALPLGLPVVGLATSVVASRPADQAFSSPAWTPTPYAPTEFDFRWTLSGTVPGVHQLSYRFIADWVVASGGPPVSPYVVGPDSPTKAAPTAELLPVDQFRTTLGLQYDLR